MKRIGLNIKTENNGNRVVIYNLSKKKEKPVVTIYLNDKRGVQFHLDDCMNRFIAKKRVKRNDWRLNIQTLVDSSYYFYATVQGLHDVSELGTNPISERYTRCKA